MLSPPAKLEVDEFPHHEGLSEANGRQDGHPERVGKKKEKKRGWFHTLMLPKTETQVLVKHIGLPSDAQ